MTVHAQDTTRDSFGDNYTIMPARGIVPRVQVDRVRADAAGAPRELYPLYWYQHYDDAVAIYRRNAQPFDEHDTWDMVGAIFFAPIPDEPDVLEIFALEVEEGFERGDVARHIPLLFGVDAMRQQVEP